MGELSPWHWIIVLLIFGLLFGSKKLPDAARGLGRSMRIFKAEMQSAQDDGAAPAAASAATATASAPFATATDPAEPTTPAVTAASPAPADPFQDALPVQDAVPVQDAAPPAHAEPAGAPAADR
jgi:sec-independent protein translocase protein TatA